MEEPRARRTDPATSHEAAASIGAKRANLNQGHVLIVMRVLGGRCTDEELVSAYTEMQQTDMWSKRLAQQSPSGIRTRRKELAEMGKVEEAGHKVKRRNGRDLKHTIWRALDEKEVTSREGTMRRITEGIAESARKARTEGTLFDPQDGQERKYHD